MSQALRDECLEQIRSMREQFAAFRSEMREDLSELRFRLSGLEQRAMISNATANSIAISTADTLEHVERGVRTLERRAGRFDDRSVETAKRLARNEEKLKLTDA